MVYMDPFGIILEIYSHSYDNPNSLALTNRRNSAVVCNGG
jgi:hypothetical protein